MYYIQTLQNTVLVQVLSQIQEVGVRKIEREVVIAYTSKHLIDRETKWSTIGKEL